MKFEKNEELESKPLPLIKALFLFGGQSCVTLFSSREKLLRFRYVDMAKGIDLRLSTPRNLEQSRREFLEAIVNKNNLSSEQADQYQKNLLASERTTEVIIRANHFWHAAWLLIIPLLVLISFALEYILEEVAQGNIVRAIFIAFMPVLGLAAWNLFFLIINLPFTHVYLTTVRLIANWWFLPNYDVQDYFEE